MSSWWRAHWRLLGKLAVAGIILALLFLEIPLAEVGRVLQTAAVWPVVAGLIASLSVQAVGGLRLGHLLHALGASLPLPTLVQVNLATAFYGLFLPGGNIAGAAVPITVSPGTRPIRRRFSSPWPAIGWLRP